MVRWDLARIIWIQLLFWWVEAQDTNRTYGIYVAQTMHVDATDNHCLYVLCLCNHLGMQTNVEKALTAAQDLGTRPLRLQIAFLEHVSSLFQIEDRLKHQPPTRPKFLNIVLLTAHF